MTDRMSRKFYNAGLMWSAKEDAESDIEYWRIRLDLWIDGLIDQPEDDLDPMTMSLAYLPMTPLMELEKSAVIALEKYSMMAKKGILSELACSAEDKIKAYHMLVKWVDIVVDENPELNRKLKELLDAEMIHVRI